MKRIAVLAATLLFAASVTVSAGAPATAASHPTPSWRICPPQCIV